MDVRGLGLGIGSGELKMEKKYDYEGDLDGFEKYLKKMNKTYSFMKIMKDLVDNLKSNKKNMKHISPDYYLYDRQKFVRKYHEKDRDIDLSYHIDLESISTFLIQLNKYGRIIMTDDDDRDIRTKQIIEEKNIQINK